MKFVGIVGTNAEFSYNRLLTFMEKHFADTAEMEVLEIKDMPLFNETDDQTESDGSILVQKDPKKRRRHYRNTGTQPLDSFGFEECAGVDTSASKCIHLTENR